MTRRSIVLACAVALLFCQNLANAQTATQRVLKNTSPDRTQFGRPIQTGNFARQEVPTLDNVAQFIAGELAKVRAAYPVVTVPTRKPAPTDDGNVTERAGEAPAAPAASAAPAAPASFKLTYLRFDRSAYLEDSVFEEFNRQLAGRQVNLAILSAVPAIINQIYAQTGILTGSAVLPPQTSKDGVIHVRLIEPVLGDIQVSNVGRTRPEYIKNRINAASGEHPQFRRLAQDLFVFSTLNNMNITARFEPSGKLDVVDLVLLGDNPKEIEWRFSGDNHGASETGEERLSVNFQHLNLTGRRDILNVSGERTEGLSRGSVNYSAPLGLNGDRVSFGGSYSSSEVVNGILAPTDLTSESLSGFASYQYPLVVQPDQIGWIGVTANVENLIAEIAGVTLTDTVIQEGVLFTNWLWRQPKFTAATNVQLAFGEADSAVATSTDGNFSYVQGGLDLVGTLEGNLGIRLGVQGKYGFTRNNPSSVQYSVGGVGTVRGYPETHLSGDTGANFTIELFPAQPLTERVDEQVKATFQPFVFFDAGFAVPFRLSGRAILDEDIIAGAGFGFRHTYGEHISGSFTLSFPLRDTLGFDAHAEGPRASYTLVATF